MMGDAGDDSAKIRRKATNFEKRLEMAERLHEEQVKRNGGSMGSGSTTAA